MRHLQISVDPSNPISEMLFLKPVEYHKLKRKSGIEFVHENQIISLHACARIDEKHKVVYIKMYQVSKELLT